MSQSEQSPLDKHAGAYIAKMGDLVVDSIWSTCVGQCINPLCNLDGTQADKHCERLYISRERFDQHIAPKLRELVAIEHRLHIAHLSAASSSDAPLVTIREDVARFLLGEGPLEGVWWGEMNHKRDALFWWRNPLRVSMHPFALSSASTPKDCPTCGGDGKLTDQPGTFKDCTTCGGCGKVVPFGNRLLRASYGVSHASTSAPADGIARMSTAESDRWLSSPTAVSTPIEKHDRDYLRGLVRMDIRGKERGLAKFAPRPDQPAEEAEAVRQQFEERLTFMRGVLERLSATRGSDG